MSRVTAPPLFYNSLSALLVEKILPRKQQQRPPYAYLVPLLQHRIINDSPAVDEYPVFAEHIDRFILVIFIVEAYPQMFARNQRIEYLDRQGLVPTDHVRPPPQRVIVILFNS